MILRAAIRLGVLLSWSALALNAQQKAAEESCSGCHEQKVTGAHTAVGCGTCHEKHEEYPHPAKLPKPVCATCHDQIAMQDEQGAHGRERKAGNAGAPDCTTCHGAAHEVAVARTWDFKSKVPETCGMCHDSAAADFTASVHGKGIASGLSDAPVCTSCHGAHGVQPKSSGISPVNPLRIRDTCESCHGNLRLSRKFGLPADRVLSFDASFHGLAARTGSQTVANCASCHGFHSILPSTDPKSSTHPKNLDATCGRCHQGAGERFALGPIHVVDGGKGEHPAVGWVRETYLILIPLTIGLMLLHNAGDLIRKLWSLRIQPSSFWTAAAAPVAGAIRMLPFERIQHALLAVSFIILAWTGFALKYPDQWWAAPLNIGGGAARAYIHRIAAVVMTAVSVIHLVSLIVSKPLREHWIHMLPRLSDAREGLAWIAYNLGLRKKKPVRSSHSYIEKAEYWAVVWGAVVMAATGFALWANTFMLRFFPKWLLDVATAVHFYEAVLATLAIIVWHFYFVIFDPDVYPLDTAWLTGRSARRHPESHAEQHSTGD